MPIIYHLAVGAEWEAGAASSEYGAGEYRAGSLPEEGFIHCSEDEAQMLRVANRLFNGRTDLIVLDLNVDTLTSPLKREPSRSGEIYPHIYGPINTDAVVRVRRLVPDADGIFGELLPWVTTER